jgi:hypothetical protein
MLQDKKYKQNNKRNGLSGGVRYGPPPKKGPNPQGLELNHAKKLLRKSFKKNKILFLAGIFDGEGSFGIWGKGDR